MLQVAIVEDEQAQRECLKQYIEQYGAEHGLSVMPHLFLDGEALLRFYEPKYDIILMDIEMPGRNGMEIAEKIRETDEKTVIMFITNMAQYAIRGYSVGALDFVMKPVTYYTFQMKFHRAVERASERKDSEIILQTKEDVVRMPVRDIYYVEVQNRQLHYHTSQGEFLVRATMTSAEEKLGPYHFTKCNHWYLVNLRHVQQVKKDVAVVAGKELEISRRVRSSFLNALTDYMGGNI